MMGEWGNFCKNLIIGAPGFDASTTLFLYILLCAWLPMDAALPLTHLVMPGSLTRPFSLSQLFGYRH